MSIVKKLKIVVAALFTLIIIAALFSPKTWSAPIIDIIYLNFITYPSVAILLWGRAISDD